MVTGRPTVYIPLVHENPQLPHDRISISFSIFPEIGKVNKADTKAIPDWNFPSAFAQTTSAACTASTSSVRLNADHFGAMVEMAWLIQIRNDVGCLLLICVRLLCVHIRPQVSVGQLLNWPGSVRPAGLQLTEHSQRSRSEGVFAPGVPNVNESPKRIRAATSVAGRTRSIVTSGRRADVSRWILISDGRLPSARQRTDHALFLRESQSSWRFSTPERRAAEPAARAIKAHRRIPQNDGSDLVVAERSDARTNPRIGEVHEAARVTPAPTPTELF